MKRILSPYQAALIRHLENVADIKIEAADGALIKRYAQFPHVMGFMQLAKYNRFMKQGLDPLEKDTIFMVMDPSHVMWEKVLLHELMHMTGAAQFLDRFTVSEFLLNTRIEQYKEEVLAEQGSLELIHEMGKLTTEIHAFSNEYITFYSLQAGKIDFKRMRIQLDAAKNLIRKWLSDFDSKDYIFKGE